MARRRSLAMSLTNPTMFPALLLSTLLTGCTTQLTREGAKVNLVTAPKASACDVIHEFKAQGSSADDALNIALNQAAEMGGNGLGVESVNEVRGDSEINGVALKCQR
jgi:outer membrane PBP1 activator LpoA protein